MINNHFIKRFTLFFVLLAVINSVNANNSSLITVKDGYIKASIPGSNITAAYMTLTNNDDQSISLQKVTSDISERIEMHEHSMADGMMRMREVKNITLDAKSQVVLQPSGLHLMIFSIKHPVSESDHVKLTLHFTNNTELNIQLPVYRYK